MLWVLIPLIFSRVGMSLRVLIGILLLIGWPPSLDVWADGSLVRDEVSGSVWAGAGVYARLHADNWRYPALGAF